MIKRLLVCAVFAAAINATSALAADTPKFGKTCVGNSGLSSSICLTSNGKTIASTYIFRGKFRTKGLHKGCALKGNSITCAGGTYSTPQGSDKMNRVVVKLNSGKPVSIVWR